MADITNTTHANRARSAGENPVKRFFRATEIDTRLLGMVGALLIIVAAIATPIAKTQKMREVWFYVMSGGAVLKIVTMEIARIIL